MRTAGGDVLWDELLPPTNIRIRIDANTADATRFVLHELLHILLLPLFVGRFDDTLEEVALVALEEYMFQYVKKSPNRQARWADAIKKKVDENTDPVPLEQQVKR